MADAQNVGYTVEIVNEDSSEIVTNETSMVTKESELVRTNKEMHSYSMAMSSESAGLVLLSNLCELSAKQPLQAECELPGIDEVSNDKVIVERVQNVESLHVGNYADQMPSPSSSNAEASLDAADSDYVDRGSPDSDSDLRLSATGKVRRVTKSLKFPPCFVCSGKASGSHYGVNTCEACKGFFRRYLMRHEEYKCNKGGNCKIINRNRGNCSGCRLKKCLNLGMAREKSKLGRYTLARRTETIKKVNILEGKNDTSVVDNCPSEHRYSAPRTDVLKRSITHEKESVQLTNLYSKAVVDILVGKLIDLEPFGPSIKTQEDIQRTLRTHYEHYKVKTQLFGPLPSVPSEEFYKLYTEYGIDADGRMQILKDVKPLIEDKIERYCDFAKHIPEFRTLSVRDQSNLLKSSRYDFFIVAMHRGYSEEYQMLLGKNGNAYPVESADKFCSKKLILIIEDMYKRWQKLKLNDKEMAIICSLTLMFTDRCVLENPVLVEKIQSSLVEILQRQLQESCAETAKRRFLKIIDNLTMMREGSELYLREYKLLCKNKVLLELMPIMTEFLLEDDL